MRRYRLLIVTATASLLLAVLSVAALTWIVFGQPSWFTKRYATVTYVAASVSDTPDIQSQVDDLSSRLDDLETGSGDDAQSSVDDLASSLADAETGTGDQASSSLDDVATTVSNLCDALSGYGGALGDIYLSSC